MHDWQLSWTSERSILVRIPECATQHTSSSLLADWIHSKHSGIIQSVIHSSTGVLVEFDILKCSPNDPWEIAEQSIESFLRSESYSSAALSSREIHIPVCYDEQLAPDLRDVANHLDCETVQIIEWHLSVQYQVTSMGFMPGFGYMSSTHEALRLPRKNTPRTRVPAGGVAIVEHMTAVYPQQSAGGWHLIGRTPMRLFDPNQASPALLRVGDSVRFVQITHDEFRSYGDAHNNGGEQWR